MNALLPLFLLLTANLALYWVFFGKAKFDQKMHEQLLAANNQEESQEHDAKILEKENQK